MHRLRLLIVDPSTTTRRIVRNLLREIGFTQIDELPNARGVLERLAAQPCDLVIAEAHAPLLDGFELVEILRRESALEALPVLLVTREASKEQVVRAARVGASGYIVRPLTRAALEDKILAILGLPAQAARRRSIPVPQRAIPR
jgi:two-component system, chemotaxis family, chemotaxis protein CheY